MTATNHAITGAIIGLTIGTAWALPLALLSHFICDALPHYGEVQAGDGYVASRRFKQLLVFDCLLCICLVVILAVARPTHWWLAAVCAFVATSPDLAWIPGYIRVQRGVSFFKNPNRFVQFASGIQWFQRPIGAVVEVTWLVAGVGTLVILL